MRWTRVQEGQQKGMMPRHSPLSRKAMSVVRGSPETPEEAAAAAATTEKAAAAAAKAAAEKVAAEKAAADKAAVDKVAKWDPNCYPVLLPPGKKRHHNCQLGNSCKGYKTKMHEIGGYPSQYYAINPKNGCAYCDGPTSQYPDGFMPLHVKQDSPSIRVFNQVRITGPVHHYGWLRKAMFRDGRIIPHVYCEVGSGVRMESYPFLEDFDTSWKPVPAAPPKPLQKIQLGGISMGRRTAEMQYPLTTYKNGVYKQHGHFRVECVVYKVVSCYQTSRCPGRFLQKGSAKKKRCTKCASTKRLKFHNLYNWAGGHHGFRRGHKYTDPNSFPRSRAGLGLRRMHKRKSLCSLIAMVF